MNERKQTNASDATSEAGAPARVPAPTSPADRAPRAKNAAGDLDLTVESIEPPKSMKEGFVGQER